MAIRNSRSTDKNKASSKRATAALSFAHTNTADAGGHRGTAQSAGSRDAIVRSGTKQMGKSQGR